MKKYLFYTLALVGCWLLPLGVQILVSTFYEKYFTYTSIHGVSWGIFVYYVYYYFNLIGLLLAFLLFQWKKWLLFVPYGLLSLEILQHFLLLCFLLVLFENFAYMGQYKYRLRPIICVIKPN